jgi:hypothetical protein
VTLLLHIHTHIRHTPLLTDFLVVKVQIASDVVLSVYIYKARGCMGPPLAFIGGLGWSLVVIGGGGHWWSVVVRSGP